MIRRARRERADGSIVALVAALTVSCGAHVTKLPTGAGEPAPDIAAATVEATRACRTVNSLTAVIAATGSVGRAMPPAIRCRLVISIGKSPTRELSRLRLLARCVYAFFDRLGACRMASTPPLASTARVTRSELVAVIGAICTGRLMPIR